MDFPVMKTLSCAARASLIILSVLCATRLYGHQKLPASDGTPEIDALIKQQNWAAAKVQLDQWILRHPHDAQARFKQATALARLGRNDEAIAAFETLIAHYPELPEPYNNLAALHVEQGRLDDARATLEMAINANPGYALAYQNLGALYLQLAARAYRRAAEIDPHDALTVQRQQQIQSIIAQPAATHGDAKSTIDSALALP